MKINNISKTGLYSYTRDSVYEKNDFVIYNNTIYVCNPKDEYAEISGELPDESENFNIYLGDKSINLDEYINFLDSSEGVDKYISTLMLKQVLNLYLLGPNEKGIIGNTISYKDGTLEVNITDSALTSISSNPKTIISDIMKHPDINHALLRVSRTLPELVSYIGSIPEDNSLTATNTDKLSCILKQYTYLSEETGNKIRIQELIDPIYGLIYYRSADINSDDVSNYTEFKCATVNTMSLKEKADQLFNLYNSRLEMLDSLETHLKSNFRFRRVDLGDNKSDSVNIEESDLVSIFPEITINVTEEDPESGIRTVYESVLSVTEMNNDNLKYKVGNCIVGISSSLDGINISLLDNPNNAWISGLYYREFYNV